MILPPSVLRVRVQSTERRIAVWFPIFLFWPLMVLVALVLLPIVLVLAILLWPIGWSRTPTRGLPQARSE